MTCGRGYSSRTKFAITVFWLAGCGANSKPALGPGVTDLLDEHSPFATREPAAAPVANPCKETDRSAATAVWDKLRNSDYPFHLQAIALSPPFPSGCRALIVAEPPPAITLDQLRDVSPGLLTMIEVREHKVGYDGWTKDRSEEHTSELQSPDHL